MFYVRNKQTKKKIVNQSWLQKNDQLLTDVDLVSQALY